jgi:hypothetical protein
MMTCCCRDSDYQRIKAEVQPVDEQWSAPEKLIDYACQAFTQHQDREAEEVRKMANRYETHPLRSDHNDGDRKYAQWMAEFWAGVASAYPAAVANVEVAA